MGLRPLIAAAGVVLGACAGLDPAECRGADWYDLGFRDAIFGLPPQEDVYAAHCARHGLKPDAARYAQGWREGKYEADHRRNESMD